MFTIGLSLRMWTAHQQRQPDNLVAIGDFAVNLGNQIVSVLHDADNIHIFPVADGVSPGLGAVVQRMVEQDVVVGNGGYHTV